MIVCLGSSPLTRGKRVRQPDQRSRLGLIPAHAGKTLIISATSSMQRAHPRSRGENSRISRSWRSVMGSSPLTRGKRMDRRADTRREGLIPAHAGKTGLPGGVSKNTGAHPRSRGENGAAAGEVSARRGSSPLTRGKLTFPISCKGGGGLIPAHAGKTTPCPAPSTWAWAHPRSRGENNAPLEMAIFQRGSSPLTRGKPRACHAVLAPSGLIPAHAGKTYSSMVLWKLLRAHPRSRGENDLVAGEALLEPGSSPLTRGKHDTRVSRVLLDGLIPAHAGKTCASRAAT